MASFYAVIFNLSFKQSHEKTLLAVIFLEEKMAIINERNSYNS